MAHRKYRLVGFGMLALGGAGILGMTSMLHPAPALADSTDPDYALILGPGGFGNTTELPTYVSAVDSLYLDNSHIIDGATNVPYSDYDFNLVPVDTPEGIFPTSLGTLDSATNQAVSELNTAIETAIGNADGGQVTVFGYSESATTAVLLQEQLQAQAALGTPLPYSPEQLTFVLVGDPSNPDGGLYERLVPSLATDLPYHTDIYTQEYDGFADFPKYPSDVLADVNAELGAVYDHLTYADLTPSQIDSAIPLASTDPNGDYFMIPTTDLPLLDPLRLLGAPGNAMADLLQPDATLLVNLGYGNLSFTEGYDLGPANVPSPFGLMPDVNMSELGPMLEQGWQEGMAAAASDLANSAAYTFGSSPALTELEDAAYTFGITNTQDPSILEFLQAVGQWGADELGFGSSFTNFTDGFTSLQNSFTGLQDGFTGLQDGFQSFEASFADFEALLSTPWTLGGASAAEALTSGALDATPLATSLSDFATDFLSQLPGLF
jgi:hypothetical protein